MKSSNEFKVRKWWENGENYTWTLIKMINKKKIKLEGEKKQLEPIHIGLSISQTWVRDGNMEKMLPLKSEFYSILDL